VTNLYATTIQRCYLTQSTRYCIDSFILLALYPEDCFGSCAPPRLEQRSDPLISFAPTRPSNITLQDGRQRQHWFCPDSKAEECEGRKILDSLNSSSAAPETCFLLVSYTSNQHVLLSLTLFRPRALQKSVWNRKADSLCFHQLALAAPAARAVQPSESDLQVPGGGKNESASRQTAQLEIGIEYKLDLKKEDLVVLKDLGHGNGGTVSKVRHVATNTVMARKVRVSASRRRFSTSLTSLGYTCRSQNRNASANSSRTADHAQYQLGLHCQFLRGVPEREQ
jgi:hypothetical protein